MFLYNLLFSTLNTLCIILKIIDETIEVMNYKIIKV